jgi:hypothetical protein
VSVCVYMCVIISFNNMFVRLTNTHSLPHTHTFSKICMHIHTLHTRRRRKRRRERRVHILSPTLSLSFTHTLTHRHTHTHIDTHTHTCTHTHAHTRRRRREREGGRRGMRKRRVPGRRETEACGVWPCTTGSSGGTSARERETMYVLSYTHTKLGLVDQPPHPRTHTAHEHSARNTPRSSTHARFPAAQRPRGERPNIGWGFFETANRMW